MPGTITVAPRIVHPEGGYPKPALLPPTTLGYIHIGASLDVNPTPVVLPNKRRSELLGDIKKLARTVDHLDWVRRVSVFRAIVMPPTSRLSAYLKERGESVALANYDVAVVLETTSTGTARQVQKTPEYRALIDTLRNSGARLHIMAARNARRIGDVDTSSQGLFLLNHFAADDPEVMLELWEYLAGWYQAETGLTNSVAMTPLEGEPADYAIVNWARWDEAPLAHFWHQLSKKSFWNYVVANLDANRAASMPVYYRLA
jgi:hypothetical protein